MFVLFVIYGWLNNCTKSEKIEGLFVSLSLWEHDLLGSEKVGKSVIVVPVQMYFLYVL